MCAIAATGDLYTIHLSEPGQNEGRKLQPLLNLVPHHPEQVLPFLTAIGGARKATTGPASSLPPPPTQVEATSKST